MQNVIVIRKNKSFGWENDKSNVSNQALNK